jgi:hypothetical protein
VNTSGERVEKPATEVIETSKTTAALTTTRADDTVLTQSCSHLARMRLATRKMIHEATSGRKNFDDERTSEMSMCLHFAL